MKTLSLSILALTAASVAFAGLNYSNQDVGGLSFYNESAETLAGSNFSSAYVGTTESGIKAAYFGDTKV